MFKYLLISSFIFLHSSLCYAQIYKYKDEQGKWHYSDKKPTQANHSFESIKLKHSTKTKVSLPYLDTKQANGKLNYIAHNPLLISVQFFLNDAETKKKISSKVIAPQSSDTLFKQQNSLLKREVNYRYIFGDPEFKPDNIHIPPPFTCFLFIAMKTRPTENRRCTPSLFC